MVWLAGYTWLNKLVAGWGRGRGGSHSFSIFSMWVIAASQQPFFPLDDLFQTRMSNIVQHSKLHISEIFTYEMFLSSCSQSHNSILTRRKANPFLPGRDQAKHLCQRASLDLSMLQHPFFLLSFAFESDPFEVRLGLKMLKASGSGQNPKSLIVSAWQWASAAVKVTCQRPRFKGEVELGDKHHRN